MAFIEPKFKGKAWITGLFVLAWFAAKGLIEGMTMTRYTDKMASPDAPDDLDGVRVHRWFKWYHQLRDFRDVLLALAVASVFLFGIPNPAITSGLFIIGWELVEIIYSIARYRGIVKHENLFGIFCIDGTAVYAIHSARFLIGAVLFIGGILCGM